MAASDSAVDMMRTVAIRPVHRLGVVVSASGIPAGKAKEKKEVLLSPADAVEVGKRVVKREAFYRKAIDDAVGNVSRQLNSTYVTKWDNDIVIVRLSPGVVIDFPQLTLTRRGGGPAPSEISARPSLAVCLNNSRSKLWMRYIGEAERTGEAEAAQASSVQAIETFYAHTKILTAAITERILAAYKDDIAEVVGMKVELNRHYEIGFAAADVYHEGLFLIDDAKTAFNWLRQNQPALAKTYFPTRAKKAEPGPGQYFFTRQVPQSDSNIFCARASDDRTVVYGLSFHQVGPAARVTSDENTSDLAGSGALAVTADLATVLGERM